MKRAFTILAYTALCLITLTSCGKKNVTEGIPQIKETGNDHKWYYFTQNGFEETSLPQVSSLQSLKPWTESLRISDANTGKDGKGFLLVNKLGILVFDSNGEGIPVSIQDYQLFSSASASNLTFSDSIPYFTLYRNSFFNKNAVTQASSFSDENRSYLVRIAPDSRMLYPVITYGDLGLAEGGEITGSRFNKDDFYISIKTTDRGKTNFTYEQCIPIGSYESFLPVTKEGKLFINEISEQTYRNDNTPVPLTEAPERLKELLKAIPQSFAYAITLKKTDGLSPSYYINTPAAEYTPATAVMDDEWIAAIFADGTTYFAGAVKNRGLLNNGKTVAFRLPKLPKTYIYTSFCISYDYLIAGWEETDFFKTGRSGFLVVDLANLFYGKEAVLK